MLSPIGYAADVELDDLTITATRGQVSTLDLPYNVDVISAEEMEEKLYRSLPEALAETAGIMVQKTANGQGSPFIRGFTGYRTLSLIDGIRYNNSVYRDGPNEYFSLIDLYSIEQIDALNGPATVLYGSDAIGGTLNLQSQHSDYTRETGDQFYIHGRQHYRFASAEDSHLSRTEVNLGVGQAWGLHLGYSLKNFGDVDAADLGKQPNTGYDESGFDVRFDWQMNQQWRFTLAHQQLEQDNVWRTHSTVFAIPFAGTSVGSDQQRLKDQARSLSYVKLRGEQITSWLDQAILTLSYQRWDEDGDRIRSDGRRNLEEFDSAMLGMDLQLASQTRFGRLTYGLDFYEDHVDSHRTDLNADGSLNRVRVQGPIGDDAKFLVSGAYLQNEWWMTDRLMLTAGARYSYVRSEVGRYENPISGDAASYADSWNNLSAALRATFDLTEQGDQKLWVGISQSFRAPNIADVTRFGASRSNEIEVAAIGLEPETFLTYEVGYKLGTQQFRAQTALFFTDIRDYITSTPTGRMIDGLTEVSKQNSADGDIYGIEIAGEWDFMQHWQLIANFTWLDGELNSIDSLMNNTVISEPFSRTMPLTITANLRWTDPSNRFWAALQVTHAQDADRLSRGDQDDTQRIPPGGTPGYTVLDLRGGWKVTDHLKLIGGLTNLTDEAYRVHGSGSNEPGFGIDLGLSLAF